MLVVKTVETVAAAQSHTLTHPETDVRYTFTPCEDGVDVACWQPGKGTSINCLLFSEARELFARLRDKGFERA